MHQLSVLIAEDDPVVSLLLQQQLANLGHRVIGQAGDGLEAVALVREHKPDLVIMDIMMPRLDGLDASRMIMELAPTPIILLTSHSDEHLIERAYQAGVLAYLVKPVDERDLAPAIRLAVGQFDQLQALRSEVSHLKEALETRKLVERAKGILMDRLGLSEEEAFRRIQRSAREKQRTMRDIARTIIEANDLLK
ncbi:MAG: response regulator [Chloroflexi bacterium]|nr:MAG: response regulator [Chloroflexota bacterium]